MTDKEKQIKDVYDMFVSKGMVVGYRTKWDVNPGQYKTCYP